MSHRIQTAVELLRLATRDRWSLYFDLFCMAAVGMNFRPAIASVSPLLISTWESLTVLRSRPCPFRLTVQALSKAIGMPAFVGLSSPCATVGRA
jgi:hypothetical protein